MEKNGNFANCFFGAEGVYCYKRVLCTLTLESNVFQSDYAVLAPIGAKINERRRLLLLGGKGGNRVRKFGFLSRNNSKLLMEEKT